MTAIEKEQYIAYVNMHKDLIQKMKTAPSTITMTEWNSVELYSHVIRYKSETADVNKLLVETAKLLFQNLLDTTIQD